MPDVPGVTVNRYCSSSLQTTRMAAHAISAGEGDCFISAGVETVSRFLNGMSDGMRNAANPKFDEAMARTAERAEGKGGAPDWAPPKACPTSTSPWARRPRTWPSTSRCPGSAWTSSPRCRSSGP